MSKNIKDLPGEEWRDVVGHEGEYQVSNRGRVKSLSRKVPTWNGLKTLPTIILSQDVRNGYSRCRIDSVHRLVARAFIPTDDPTLHVNHKNGVKIDNRADNLEWCTPSENMQHAWATGLCSDETRERMSAKAKLRTGSKNSCWRGLVEIIKNGKVVFTAMTLKGAEEWIKQNTTWKAAHKGNISLVCNGKLKNAYGHQFRYVKD